MLWSDFQTRDVGSGSDSAFLAVGSWIRQSTSLSPVSFSVKRDARDTAERRLSQRCALNSKYTGEKCA